MPADTVLLDVSTPYSYTIWKQFRNEVCAECWRYEGGRRGFLTRRDDEGIGSRSSEHESAIGAGLWFCDQTCQTAWIAREGLETMELLRALEEARRKKEKGKARDIGAERKPEAVTMTKNFIKRQWDAVRQKEQSHKEVRKWRNLRLDNFETDMARYVLLALIHLCRERLAEKSKMATLQAQHCTQAELSKGGEPGLELGGATWSTFASLQPNELQHLRTYPELLENQLRVYQALKGRFTRSSASDQRSTETLDKTGMVKEGNGGGRQEDGGARMRNGGTDRLRGLESVVTVENVRTALSVDPGNSFGIWEVPLTDESECLGFAVYPRPSFFNHRKCLKRGRAPGPRLVRK
ncbi:uncharacterized protein LAESUDRAFT_722033 [Laetiporus sulphureus 93-53]|uniref:Uncharacterized protein n=1 Tax=Laetiporus sulphureus 93-53 TaxID=1314785 RepID=A0A165G678_9APHY|nr:uncharacterized protein LAESUDRAFT_722033 [Laetiporus sulphureus 93-53]KZT09881.1 hypothetical protein LAESUDRAFT_722033 [Laetiporus sulphureus 93-53]